MARQAGAVSQRRGQGKAKLTNRSTRPPKLPLIVAAVCLGLVLPVKLGYNQGMFAGGVVFHEAHRC